jgi:hypothetical protein
MKKVLLGLLFTSSVYAADMDTVNRFDKQYKLAPAIDKKHIITIIETPSGASIRVIDGGINTGNISKADSIKIINGRILLLNKSSELFPTL